KAVQGHLLGAIGVVTVVALAGCGAGTEKKTVSTAQPESARVGDNGYLRNAEAICRRAQDESDKVRQRFLTSPPPAGSGPLALTTEGLVRPGIEILANEAEQFQNLKPRPVNANLERFIGLFDPILVLANERLRLGVSGGDIGEAHRLEQLISELEDEQARAAGRSGLLECRTNLVRALVSPGSSD
ncbi:MAG: hypothetical protein H0T54_01235, partial [Geodermatophilaceae bacterium]|nr:hypothetical protein [Geodermatophilaceae bacterium]